MLLLNHNDTNRVSAVLTKTAWIGPLARGAWNVGKGTVKNVFGAAFKKADWKKPGNAAATWASRLAIGTGAIAGGHALYKASPGMPAQPNYTTALRNNVLAGKVSPDELSKEDLSSVKNLGMQKMSFLGTAMTLGFNAMTGVDAAKETFKKAKLPQKIVEPKIKVEGGMLS
jgi:hypothetical protein